MTESICTRTTLSCQNFKFFPPKFFPPKNFSLQYFVFYGVGNTLAMHDLATLCYSVFYTCH